MTVRVAINGFGRIGRNFLRAAKASGADIEVVAANDLGDVDMMANLLKYDSVHGRAPFSVERSENGLVVDGSSISFTSERDPAALPWGDLGIDAVVEATGVFKTGETAGKHLEAGAKRVVISAPGKDIDAMFVVGVNDDDFDPENHRIVSAASCTTNCLVPMAKVLDDAFGLRKGLITTVHAYTGTQNTVDGPHKDARRSRAAALNIIPTSTGSAKASGQVLRQLEGSLDGMAMRVPVANGSITDFVCNVEQDVTVDQVNEAFAAAAESGSLAHILDYTDEPLVSTDIIGNPASCVFDSNITLVIGDLVKVAGWYDNEWGYSNRLVELTQKVGSAS